LPKLKVKDLDKWKTTKTKLVKNQNRASLVADVVVKVPCVGGVWALMAAYPIYSYLTPNGGDEPESKVSSVNIGDIKDLPPGSGKNFKFGSMPALITHTKDGELHAFSAVCTHLGCTVQFRPEKDLIWCACHGGCYDPSSGKNVAGPPPKPLIGTKSRSRKRQDYRFKSLK
jgi:Rieske Fe-S protein